MIQRDFWLDRIKDSWKRASVVWLAGPRRTGKTTLCRSFKKARYLNCDLSVTKDLLEPPETFYRQVQEPVVIFDEVHQLPDPSRLLKIGADAFPDLRILATGSSTLAATRKFKDTLTGRKRTVLLTPVLHRELASFGVKDLRLRLHRGGLPPALLSETLDEGFYQEWLDSYFARDVEELFRVEKRSGFLRLLELLFRQSGGLMEATRLSRESGLSRPTVLTYLDVFELTHLIRILRPFHGGSRQELLKQPKVYAFDTGFVRYARGWGELREEDCGLLWEHLVLDELLGTPGLRKIHYWRDKQGHEVDFVLPGPEGVVHAVECKWGPADRFDPRALTFFRSRHPHGRNFVVTPHVVEPYSKELSGCRIDFAPLDRLPAALSRAE